jgi:hypothetical protein
VTCSTRRCTAAARPPSVWNFNDRVTVRRTTRQRPVPSQTGLLLVLVGEFALPPLWALIQQFAALARPKRTTADLVNNPPLPAGVSINPPEGQHRCQTMALQTQVPTVYGH